MGFLSRNSLSISHLSKLSHNPTPHTRVPSSPSSSSSPSPPSSSHPPPLKALMGTESGGGSGSGEEEDEEPAEDLERILLSDEEVEAQAPAPAPASGDVRDDWADAVAVAGDDGFLELLDLVDGDLHGEGVEVEEGEDLGDGEVVDGDGVLDDFEALESELMGVDDLLVGLEEVVRRPTVADGESWILFDDAAMRGV